VHVPPITAWYAAYYLGSSWVGLIIVLSILRVVLGGRRRGERGDPREEIERARRAERERLQGRRPRFARTRRLGRLVTRGLAGLAWMALVVPGRICANLRCADTVEEDLDAFAHRLYAQGHRVTRPLCLATPLAVHWFIKCAGCGSVEHLVEAAHYGREIELRVAGGRLFHAQHCTAQYLPKRRAVPQPAARRTRRPRRVLAPPLRAARPGPAVPLSSVTPPVSREQPPAPAAAAGGPARRESA
jgi:hypothetical protein